MLASDFGTGQVFWSFLWFTMFFIWIWLLIMVFSDIFRSHDLNGVSKFLWIFFIILLPYLGVFVYLIARGHKMGEHAIADAKARDEAAQAYIRQAAGSAGGGTAAELEKLAALRDSGVLDQQEFDAQKAKLLA
ncbi:MAG: Phospholipase-D-nuclease N-terminal/Short C-terminal domain [Ilumatobacteraceae bacterium]|nr:Phospholipase-D-nuclease N-terminal/Short C-terminal domain [Ilumatobacteraceae bacterium]